MFNSRKGLFSLVAVSGLLLAQGSSFAQDFHPSKVIVKYKDGLMRTNASMESLYDKVGVDSVRYFQGALRNFEVLEISGLTTVEDAVEALNRDPGVEYAQPDYILYIPEYNQNLKQAASRIADEVPEFPIPCIPGFEIPGCTPIGELPCLLPGFPPGCEGGDPGSPPATRPEVEPAPEEVDPPVADPDISKTWGISKVQAQQAWAKYNEAHGTTSAGSKDIVVGVIDTGVDYNHEDIAFNMWRNPNPTKDDTVGWDFIHDDNLPYDDQGHGTHVSGTIGAVGNNGKTISGVTQRVQIMALKFLSSSGMGQTSGAIAAIDYAIQNGAKITNNSWGSEGADPNNQALSDAIQRSQDAGVLFVAAAGNGGRDGIGDNNDTSSSRSFPAAFSHDIIVAVAASDSNDKMTFFSNYGVKSTDLAAPGAQVYSSVPGNKYTSHSGTSMACPHVVGAAALVWANNPDWTALQVKQALMDSADPIESHKGKTVTGGRLNVNKALDVTL